MLAITRGRPRPEGAPEGTVIFHDEIGIIGIDGFHIYSYEAHLKAPSIRAFKRTDKVLSGKVT